MYDLGLIHGFVWQNQNFIKTNIYINDAKIARISNDFLPAVKVVDLNNHYVSPGLIDPHVHFELDLGFIKSKDDFSSGTQAAIYGGVTTIIDFLEPVDTVEGLERAFKERMEAASKSHIDFTFHATIKDPKCDLEAFVKKMKSLNIHSLKLFTTYSESGRKTNDQDIKKLLRLSKKYDFLLLAHIENDQLIDLNQTYTFKDLSKSRPVQAEIEEALKIASFVKKTKGFLYMVHVSSGQTIKALNEQYKDIINKNFFIESCPQYFTFTEKKLQSNRGYLYTCAPPLRSQVSQDLLFQYFKDVYTIGTDHCAFLKEDKKKTYLHQIPLGIGSIEQSFKVMYTYFDQDVIPKMTERISTLFKLKNKGFLKEGYDADLMIFEKKDHQIESHHGTCDYNLYSQHKVSVDIIATMCKGRFVMMNQVQYDSQGTFVSKEV